MARKEKKQNATVKRIVASVAGFADDPDSLLAPVQVAEVLGVTRKTLEKWRTQGGHVKYLKIGGLVRYQKKAVLAYFEAQGRSNTSGAGR